MKGNAGSWLYERLFGADAYQSGTSCALGIALFLISLISFSSSASRCLRFSSLTRSISSSLLRINSSNFSRSFALSSVFKLGVTGTVGTICSLRNAIDAFRCRSWSALKSGIPSRNDVVAYCSVSDVPFLRACKRASECSTGFVALKNFGRVGID